MITILSFSEGFHMVAVEDITVAGESIAAKGETVMHEIKKSGQNGMIVDTGTTIMVGARSMRGGAGSGADSDICCITDRMMNLYYSTPPSSPLYSGLYDSPTSMHSSMLSTL